MANVNRGPNRGKRLRLEGFAIRFEQSPKYMPGRPGKAVLLSHAKRTAWEAVYLSLLKPATCAGGGGCDDRCVDGGEGLITAGYLLQLLGQFATLALGIERIKLSARGFIDTNFKRGGAVEHLSQ